MAYAEQSQRTRGPVNEQSSALAYEWRRLTRAATFVAVLTAPAFVLGGSRSDPDVQQHQGPRPSRL